MSKQTIWNYLKTHTKLPETSIAGIMGNMMAESGCESNRKQGDFSDNRQPSINYTNSIMNGTLPLNSFIHDSIGYGLCQWTFWSRKENLYNSVVVSEGKRIDNEEAQLRFMLLEMQNEFANLWRRLFELNTIEEAAKLVCVEFERPAYPNITERTNYGKAIYNEFHGKEPAPDPTPEPMGRDAIIDAIYELLEKLR